MLISVLLLVATLRLQAQAVVHHFRPSGRVIGASLDAFTAPFYCTLYVEYPDDAGSSICGCAILGDGTAITAAHCFKRLRTNTDGYFTEETPAAVSVRLYGALRSKHGGLVRVDLNSIRMLKGFRVDDLFMDIATLEIPGTLHRNNVTLNRDRADWDGLQSWNRLAVVGVGLNRFQALSLGSPKIAYLSRRSCSNPVGYADLRPWGQRWAHDDICTGPFGPCDSDKRCADSCGGDSGGPVYAVADDGSVIIYGVVSRGAGQCGITGNSGGYPGINSPTDQHLAFIYPNAQPHNNLSVTRLANLTTDFMNGKASSARSYGRSLPALGGALLSCLCVAFIA